MLAAPDFDLGEFLCLSEDLSKRCERITLYCSADDQALHLSRSLHGGYPRLGDFRGFQELTDSQRSAGLAYMDAIDTTGTDSSWLRHAYVFDACGIILDCCMVSESMIQWGWHTACLPLVVQGTHFAVRNQTSVRNLVCNVQIVGLSLSSGTLLQSKIALGRWSGVPRIEVRVASKYMALLLNLLMSVLPASAYHSLPLPLLRG